MQKCEKIIKVQLCRELIEDLNLTETTNFEARVRDGVLVIRIVDDAVHHFDEESYEEGYYEGVDDGEVDGYKIGYAIGYGDGQNGSTYDDSYPFMEDDDATCCCKCCACNKCQVYR